MQLDFSYELAKLYATALASMKVITAKEFETRFEEIIEDIEENHTHYKVILEDNKAIMAIPYQEYSCLIDSYESWLNQKNEIIDEDIYF